MNKVYLLSRITNKFFVKIIGRFGSRHSLYMYADNYRDNFKKIVRRVESLILIERLWIDANNITSKLTDNDMNLPNWQVDSFYSKHNSEVVIAANYIHTKKDPKYLAIYNAILKGEEFIPPDYFRFGWEKCNPMRNPPLHPGLAARLD